ALRGEKREGAANQSVKEKTEAEPAPSVYAIKMKQIFSDLRTLFSKLRTQFRKLRILFGKLRTPFRKFPLQALNVTITLCDGGFPGFDVLAGIDANIQEG